MIGRAAIFGGMSQSDQQVNAYQLRIVLRRTSPHIWRRVVVRSDSTLGQLHQAVQALFGWADSRPGGRATRRGIGHRSDCRLDVRDDAVRTHCESPQTLACLRRRLGKHTAERSIAQEKMIPVACQNSNLRSNQTDQLCVPFALPFCKLVSYRAYRGSVCSGGPILSFSPRPALGNPEADRENHGFVPINAPGSGSLFGPQPGGRYEIPVAMPTFRYKS